MERERERKRQTLKRGSVRTVEERKAESRERKKRESAREVGVRGGLFLNFQKIHKTCATGLILEER